MLHDKNIFVWYIYTKMKITNVRIDKLPLSIVRQLQMLGKHPIRAGQKAATTISKSTRTFKRKASKRTRNAARKIKKVTKPVVKLTSNVFDAALFGFPGMIHRIFPGHTRSDRRVRIKKNA